MENVINKLLSLAKSIMDWIYNPKIYRDKVLSNDICIFYNSDIIKILYYKMARITTDRDYYLKTLLLDGFREADKTKDKYMDWYIKTPLSEETAKIKYYRDIPAMLFMSGSQINHAPVKFLQIGINENNDKHRYKTFAEMLGTIRYLIENYIARYDLLGFEEEIRVWLHVDKETLIPELWVYVLDGKTNSWQFATTFEMFDVGVVIDYIGIDLYGIDSKTTVSTIKQNENEFKKLLDDIIYEHLSETPSQPINNEDPIEIVKDKIYVDDTFSFPFYLSHITLAPLIDYLVKFFDINLYEKYEKSSQSSQSKKSKNSIQNYLDAVFENDYTKITHHVLNKKWYCDFGVLANCDYDDVEYNRLTNKKELVDKYLKYENPYEFESIYQLGWYLFTKDCPRPIIDYIIKHYRYYDNAIIIFNFLRLIYDMIKFEEENLTLNDYLEYLADDDYIKNIYQTIESSSYVKQLIDSKLDPKFYIDSKISYESFVEIVMLNYPPTNEIISLDEHISLMIENDFKKYGRYKLPKIINE